VAPPAILYAIPVERLFELPVAQSINVWFLAIVAVWRVALLVFFLARQAGLGWARVVVGTALPLTLLVTALTVLNLERATLDLMAGRHGPAGPNDAAYEVLASLTLFSVLAFVPVAIVWIILVARRNDAFQRMGPIR
jgi:hypothetical protein